jgi:predicted ribonuclease YlaK
MANKKKTTTEQRLDPPEKIEADAFYGIPLDEEQLVFANAIWNKDNDIVMVSAKAGTGKTTVATGVANLLVLYGFYRNLIYIMSPYGERKQGWLPGSITEKSSVYFEAFYQALVNCNVDLNTAINNETMVNQKYGTGYITCITDTFLRGTNLDDAVVIIDEAQNYTVPQLKKVLTRVGKKAKVIVIGHDLQCDLDNAEQSGFIKYLNHFKDCERAAVCTLTTNHRSWISKHADDLQE